MRIIPQRAAKGAALALLVAVCLAPFSTAQDEFTRPIYSYSENCSLGTLGNGQGGIRRCRLYRRLTAAAASPPPLGPGLLLAAWPLTTISVAVAALAVDTVTVRTAYATQFLRATPAQIEASGVTEEELPFGNGNKARSLLLPGAAWGCRQAARAEGRMGHMQGKAGHARPAAPALTVSRPPPAPVQVTVARVLPSEIVLVFTGDEASMNCEERGGRQLGGRSAGVASRSRLALHADARPARRAGGCECARVPPFAPSPPAPPGPRSLHLGHRHRSRAVPAALCVHL